MQVQACLCTVISPHKQRGQGAVAHQGAGGKGVELECDHGMPDSAQTE